ncbi:hypothetical protein AA101099_2355 [Neoasaia chiangmaiensis NBRC 101099]|uniref:Lysozyme inhibitor LprI-like N-terminal domain-containing protein n=2 Tax=Neoasaia chiangmaiensis TaxID=320497 RepID=A0A1U9KSR6_9PROT|nr:hypothetical protein A0U93_13120 [Neoasaia chiangmaiensis]GBR40993.1 hypothetical protein AA101099_2355 [Neoasaia chiangmaiensis NBRC 101099]
MKRVLFLLLAALEATPGMASDFDTCLKAADSIDPRIMDCQDKELIRQNAALNASYSKLLTQLRTIPLAESKLRDSERAWIKFRDANCDLIPAVFGDGSADRINYNDCVIDITSARVIELNKWNSSRTVEGR